MTKLKDKVQNGLDESRILVLGAQVLLGFQYRLVLEQGFEKLPRSSQYLTLVGLALLLASLALMIVPAAYHRITTAGEDTKGMQRFTTKAMGWALLPFAISLGINFYTMTEKLLGTTPGVIAGATSTACALFFWYGLEAIRKPQRAPEIKEKSEMSKKEEKQGQEESGEEKIKSKIRHVLALPHF